jgi:glycosyltransferase involved in cell wall biosynthesis
MPLALLEASSCGLPLIAFDCPSGPGEIIENGENGFLIKDVGDIQAMADKICQVIEDDELRKQMGGKAKEMVGKFRIDSIREQWMDLFNAVVE